MAYNNNNNRNGGNRQPNWKRKKYQLPNGKRQDPMGDSRSMGNFAMRLFRDMARGQFNFLVDGPKFMVPEFVEAAMQSVTFEIRKSYEIYMAVSSVYDVTTDTAAADVVQNAQKRNQAYQMCYQVLMNIKASNYADINYLQTLTNMLPMYRFNM